MTLSAADFIAALEAENVAFYATLPETEKVYWTRPLQGPEAAEALKPRWFNEWRIGVESLGGFVRKVDDPTLKILVGRQIGDEAKHARLIQQRIEALGGSVANYDPPPSQLRFAELLDAFEYPEEYFAAEQLTIETQSVRRNELALSRFDAETAEMFERHVNDDERFHVQVGRIGLRRYATTSPAQDRARRAVERVREIHRSMVREHNVRMQAAYPG